MNVIIEELKTFPSIKDVSASSNIPGEELNSSIFSGIDEGGSSISNNSKFMFVNHEFINMMDMKILQGRNFDKTYSTEDRSVILNKAAFNNYGWENDDKTREISWGAYTGEQPKFEVIGVIDDFQWLSVHNKIDPVIIFPREIPISLRLYMFVRIEPDSDQESLNLLNGYFKKFDIRNELSFKFLNQEVRLQYNNIIHPELFKNSATKSPRLFNLTRLDLKTWLCSFIK